jgi:sarcosine oxidase subunit gamma
MSNAVSALQGAEAAGAVSVREMGLRGMITLRGELSNAKLRKVCTELTQVGFPEAGQARNKGEAGLAWMSPDEILVMVPYAAIDDALAKIATAMEGQHHLVVNVSDARAVLAVEGPFARDVIAKLAPVDLHPDSFQPGDFRRSRLGQVAAAFWLQDTETFYVICFRSAAHYAFDLLAMSAKAGPVGHFPTD